MEKLCNTCNTVKPLEEFYKRKLKSGSMTTQGKCITCLNEYMKNHYRNNKEMYSEKARRNEQRYFKRNRDYVISYFKTHPCISCGEEDILVLEFHHNGVVDKEYNVTSLINSGSLKSLKEEIAKCDVMCANCHRRLEATKRDFWKTQYAQ